MRVGKNATSIWENLIQDVAYELSHKYKSYKKTFPKRNINSFLQANLPVIEHEVKIAKFSDAVDYINSFNLSFTAKKLIKFLIELEITNQIKKTVKDGLSQMNQKPPAKLKNHKK